ncbi:MAG: TldD/PmbA family protein [Desulfarculales bacterium]|jgi:PmbA protein|nr:TldD/PmbA family protein [Desulfarculales bacterium]
MLEKMLDQVSLRLEKSPARQWEIFLAHNQRFSLSIKENEVDKIEESESMGLALRVLKEDRLGFSYLIGSDLNRLDAAIHSALAGAAAGDPAPGLTMAPAARYENGMELYFAPEETDACLDLARRMAGAALAVSSKVSHVFPAGVEQKLSQTFLRTSQGFDGQYRDSLVSAYCAVIAQDKGQQEEAWEGTGARRWKDIDVSRIGREAAGKAVSGLGAAKAPGGLYQVLFTNEVAAYFVDLLSFSLQGDNLGKGRSQLLGRQGEKLFSPVINLSDNPLAPLATGSRPFDDEGTPSQITPLIIEGVFSDFIRDRYWGIRSGLASTGNSRRSGLKGPPQIGFSNLILAPGKASFDQLRSQMERGLIVEQILGGHTADPVSGQFSLGLAGKLVEKGEITTPVRGNALAGQIMELFAGIRQLGNDIKDFSGTQAPSMLAADIAISG